MNDMGLSSAGRYTSWTSVLVGAVLGAIAAILIYIAAISGNEAVAILQAGRVGGMESVQTKVSPTLVVDRRGTPQLLIDKMQTLPFTEKVAMEAGVPDEALGLAAVQYGGRGKLRVRSISDGTLVEIRAKSGTAQSALKLVDAALRLGLADEETSLAPVRALVKQRISELEGQKERTQAIAGALTKAVVQASNGQSSGLDSAALSAAANMEVRIQAVTEDLWQLEAGTVPPQSQDTTIFSPAALIRPIVGSWLTAALAGLIAGAAAGMAYGILLTRARSVG